jgi:hypothetical protein
MGLVAVERISSWKGRATARDTREVDAAARDDRSDLRQVLSQPAACSRSNAIAALRRYPKRIWLVYDYPDALIEKRQHPQAPVHRESVDPLPDRCPAAQLAAKSCYRRSAANVQRAPGSSTRGMATARRDRSIRHRDQGRRRNFYQISTAESRLRPEAGNRRPGQSSEAAVRRAQH